MRDACEVAVGEHVINAGSAFDGAPKRVGAHDGKPVVEVMTSREGVTIDARVPARLGFANGCRPGEKRRCLQRSLHRVPVCGGRSRVVHMRHAGLWDCPPLGWLGHPNLPVVDRSDVARSSSAGGDDPSNPGQATTRAPGWPVWWRRGSAGRQVEGPKNRILGKVPTRAPV